MSANTIGFKLLMSSYTETHDDGDHSGEPYSQRDTTSTSWYFEGVRLEDKYPDAILYLSENESFDPSLTYYYLYAIYSTGDSFGRDEGNGCESLIVYKDQSLAEQVAEMLRSTKNYSVSVPNGAGGFIDIHCPWVGYFEDLNDIEVVAFQCASA